MSNLKVCHLTPTFFSEESVIGGGERYVNNLIQAVKISNLTSSQKIDQSIISISDKAKSFVSDDVTVHLLESVSRIGGNMNYIPFKLWEFLGEFDVIHLHQGLTQFGEFCAAVTASLNIPFVVTDLGGGSSNLMLYGRGLELANRVIAISEYANTITKSCFSGKVDIVIGPIDTNFFVPSNNRISKKKYGICVSRILPHKGIDRIISALPEQLELKVVGKIFDYDYFELLKDLAKGKKIEFITNASDELLLSLYQEASIFLQGSTHKDIYGNIIYKPELMGLTTLEAMSCGLPVVVSDAGSLPEMVPNNRVGRVFRDHYELLSVFDDYMNEKWPSNTVHIEARNFVVDNYSFLKVGELLSRIYCEVAQE